VSRGPSTHSPEDASWKRERSGLEQKQNIFSTLGTENLKWWVQQGLLQSSGKKNKRNPCAVVMGEANLSLLKSNLHKCQFIYKLNFRDCEENELPICSMWGWFFSLSTGKSFHHSWLSVSCQQPCWAAGQRSGTERNGRIFREVPSFLQSEIIKEEATEEVSELPCLKIS